MNEPTSSPSPAYQEYTGALRVAESDLDLQTEAIYDLLKAKADPEKIRALYNRAAELIAEKYHVLLAILEEEKNTLSAETYDRRVVLLQQGYKNDLVDLAAAIGEAIEPPENPFT